MDVPTLAAQARTTFNTLNHAHAAERSLPSAWDDSLNEAMEARAGTAPSAGINGAAQTFAQFAQRQTQLNARLRKLAQTDDAFNGRTADRQTGQGDQPMSEKDAELQKTAEQLVNSLFMGTMLKGMRNSPFKDDLFSGGKAGNAYAGMFDQQLTQHAGGGLAQDLVRSMVKAYRKHQPNPDNGLPHKVNQVSTAG